MKFNENLIKQKKYTNGTFKKKTLTNNNLITLAFKIFKTNLSGENKHLNHNDKTRKQNRMDVLAKKINNRSLLKNFKKDFLETEFGQNILKTPSN